MKTRSAVVRTWAAAGLVVFVVAGVAALRAQNSPSGTITSPKAEFGWEIGDDYRLVNYTQYEQYLKKMDQQSDRMTVIDIGKTAEGRTEYTAIITSPENHRSLAKHKDVNRRLALAEGLTDEQARQLARDGKMVIWIDGGLHATEVLGAQQLIDLIYTLNTRTDPETMRILNDDIVLCTLVNPDGMELVSNWYMRHPDERLRSTAGLPRLYQKYIGHDNNRDFYMMNQPESENANRIMYRDWFPAIMYNHHQTGPAGAVLFAPPFRDPFNYNFDPLIPLGIDMVGAAIHTRLAVEGKPGAVMRSGAPYSTWFNGGIRTTSYFHNQIGILTETIGNPTPVEIPFVPEMQLPRGDVPNPIAPQTWHFRQSIEYSRSMNYAILDLASRRREDFLFNMYKMGKNAIDNGSRDHWTIHPKRIDAVRAEAARMQPRAGRGLPASLYRDVLRDPSARDPRGFILPSDQPDFLTATKLVNTLIKAGVVVHRATAPFAVAAKPYPAGSYVVKAAQAYRAHLLDMFEPQDHPDDIPYPGSAPRPPYDVTGYNIAYSMGVRFDRLLDGFDGPFETLTGVVSPPVATIAQAPSGGGYLISHQMNDAFVAVNRLLKANEEVYWLKSAVTANGRSYAPGAMYVPAKATTLPILRKLAAEKGVTATAVAGRPSGTSTGASQADAMELRPVRIGLWDVYGGSMPSGWTRWLLEQFEFSFEVVFAKTLDAGNLAARFDVLIFADGGIPSRDGGTNQPPASTIPMEFRDWLGSVSVSRTVPELRKFVEAGGTLLTIGSSTIVGQHFGLPIGSALVERDHSGAEVPLPGAKFYVPGSILEARVDNTHPLGYGFDDTVNIFFDHSEAFRVRPQAAAKGMNTVAWIGTPAPLKSGWAWGQQYLDQAVEIVEAPIGKGRVVLFGPEIVWRGQPHGTFKFLFNGIYYGAARSRNDP
ncbi:MAG: peptidase [Acidobacteria bacterium RIFCSPLOWO2_02_FULL_65_29]|nr:MAG: peptidase [Acidobacteria bacterium RIFCSPLOWO2_02_FULL_65_29]